VTELFDVPFPDRAARPKPVVSLGFRGEANRFAKLGF
jgi:hypothetical protein